MKNPIFESVEDHYLLKNIEGLNNEIKCPLCWEKDRVMVHEWMGAYDGWLTLECAKCWKQTHRITKKPITEMWQPEEWWPVFFKTGRKYFRNLTPITKKEWEEVKK